ncbi:MAG: hypothetical protein ABSH20_16790 [Tepidisphaeraceae bacterium]|jgi:hypothetical protein
MNVKLDENLPLELADFLATVGHDGHTVLQTAGEIWIQRESPPDETITAEW